MRLQREHIHPIEQPVQLASLQFHHFARVIARPRKAIRLQLLLPQNESVALPEKELYVISSAITECEQVCTEGVEFELFLYENRETPYLFSEIDNVAAQVNAHLIDRPDHG